MTIEECNRKKMISEVEGKPKNKEEFACVETDYYVLYDYEDRLSGLDVAATEEKVSNLLKECGLKDREIGEKIGVTAQAVNKWRHRLNYLDIENLYVLSGVLRVKVDDFLVPRKRRMLEKCLIETGNSDKNPGDGCPERLSKYASMQKKSEQE